MVGHCLGDCAITYPPIDHGKPEQGSTPGSKFASLT